MYPNLGKGQIGGSWGWTDLDLLYVPASYCIFTAVTISSSGGVESKVAQLFVIVEERWWAWGESNSRPTV